MPAANNTNKFLTLSEILSQVRIVVAREFSMPIWIKADMLKLNHYSASGHAFPELVEKTNGKVTAKCQSMIWADDLQRIATNFRQVTGKTLSDGIEILFRAEIRFHEQFGMRLRIIDIDAQYTLGQMAMERKKTIEKLKTEELFFLNKQISLAEIPGRLAIISAATSRGMHDLKNIIFTAGAAYKIKMTLFTAVLQGARGAETIASRILQIGKRADEFDAILIIRGGGDDTGMDCYDDYALARTVCECQLPVITGIGHSTNETVTEMVAHTNKITPTDVAYFVVGKFSEQLMRLQDLTAQLSAQALMTIAEQEQFLQDLAQSVSEIAREEFQQQKDFLMQAGNIIQQKSFQKVAAATTKLDSSAAELRTASQRVIMTQQHRTDMLNSSLSQHFQSFIRKNNSTLDILESKVTMLDPQNILRRGYSITLHEGKIVKSGKALKDGSEIETVLLDGRVKSIVQKNKKDKK
ncbi:MAG: exodeoxyribonuclease VII large subunit [Bacteroidetes bacterium GWF2_43_63]|nr:MAG: exodeoxyribonuclease VII large subunit [Bacteroidetes bacterium GWE2_42_42]OFY53236.1 MAG: exodeoxyribonuclease VII large subunit [Bacteroidetes bacterium GWF2_43_63]HBG71772.1 exodeoxyribonuclease VII large subunit [Bacteroidales bacterium]HCB61563.1 exodeoxyribonuclease VII large subunit [Bacteroidales bacterium]HCY22775.1 exodeoxyribonuclease VII large subunit [Bacteroidales bacterium]